MSRLFIRLGIGVIFAIFGMFNYFTNVSENPITGERQRVQLSPQQEIVIGRQSAPQMAAQHGNLYPDQLLQNYVDLTFPVKSENNEIVTFLRPR